MKSYFLSALLVILCLYSCTSDSVGPRIVRLEGKGYEIVSQTRLSEQMTYLRLRENAQSVTLTYLINRGVMASTVFTESELRAFLTSGKLEDLGKVETLRQSNNSTIPYIVKGSTNVFVVKEKDQVDFVEKTVPVGASVAGTAYANETSSPGTGTGTGTAPGNGTPPPNPLIDCLNKCSSSFYTCKYSPARLSELMCLNVRRTCEESCRKSYPQ